MRYILKGLIILFTLGLVACGGGGNDGGSDGSPVSGVLVVPDNSKSLSLKVLNKAALRKNSNCPNVPTGYAPLASTNIDFLDQSGAVLSSATTDECGAFSGTVAAEVVTARAQAADFRELRTEISTFLNGGGGVASTIPATATYEISSIQLTGVIDSITNTAVIGIPQSAFSLDINSVPTTIDNISSAAQLSDPASIALVLDASGSMLLSVFDSEGNVVTDENDNPLSRNRITTLASHAYLDSMPSTDETAFVMFGSDVHFVNDAYIAASFSLQDSTANAATYTFSESGYTNIASDLRFVVDTYDRDSIMYSSGTNELHPDTPALTSMSSYPYSGLTAFYDGIEEGLINTAARNNSRKLVIAMSDGGDNRSTLDVDGVIASALAKSIPVSTLSIGGVDTADMERIATETNGKFFDVEDQNFAGIFQTIQTGIIFQYIASYTGVTVGSDVLTLNLSYNGVTVSRGLTL